MDLGRLRDFWKSLEPKGQMTLVGAALAVLVTGFLLFKFSSRPSYSTLASNLDPADAGEITKSLEGAGIGYKVAHGGTEVDVRDADISPARIALSKSGLPRSGHVGFELFDKKSLGATDFQQQVDYQRALEGEIARTIEQIDGVNGAQVSLVLPEDTLFANEGPKASAAVLLDSSELDGATVKGIAHLVSGSVKDLDPQNVTITDSTGRLLWPSSDSSGGLTAAGKLEAEQLYSAQVAGQVNALLASTLGAGKAQARVHATLSLDQTTIDKVTYGKKGTPLTTQTDDETLGSKGGASAATPSGVASNVPTYGSGTAAGGSGGQSNYNHKTSSTQFGVDKTIERTTVAPGAVQKLDVAVVVDSSIPKAQLASLKTAVAGATGIDTTRGDTLSVSSVKFATGTASKPTSAGPLGAIDPIQIAKTAAMVLGALVFLFLMRRNLKRREGDPTVPEPTWLREIEAHVPIAELDASGARAALEAANEQKTELRGELQEIAKAQPEQVAAQVSQWLKS
jgi:flagellar M-ring protein FliF